MTEKLKHFFNEKRVREIAADLVRAHPAFDAEGLVARGLDGLDRLELSARAGYLADALHVFLPRPFSKAADVILASLGPEIAATGENGMAPFRYMPHVCFVQKYGLDDFEAAMQAQYELTKRFSAEWSIRAFLVRYPQETYARLCIWASDESAHVRRLVSEGTRPRLPWAPRLRAFQNDPRPVIALLEKLKDDPERYVQRSVASNLNDIGKDHPDLVVEICSQWQIGAPAERAWIVKHALRSLVKKGHSGALRAMGADCKPEVRITNIRLSPGCVTLGGKLRFAFTIESTSNNTQDLLIDYAVHFVKANGATRPKVFKLRKISLAPFTHMKLESTVSFAELTTRKHYPGRHQIDLLINGVTSRLAAFDVARVHQSEAAS